MRTTLTLSLLATIATLFTPASALAADSNGAKGRVVEVSVNEPSSDDYAKFHGAIVVRGDDKSKTTYRWGGSFCPGLAMSAESVERLTSAFLTRRWTKIVPHFKNGQGGNKCLVGYELKGKATDGPS